MAFTPLQFILHSVKGVLIGIILENDWFNIGFSPGVIDLGYRP